jgi:hypothetical protein
VARPPATEAGGEGGGAADGPDGVVTPVSTGDTPATAHATGGPVQPARERSGPKPERSGGETPERSLSAPMSALHSPIGLHTSASASGVDERPPAYRADPAGVRP